MTTLATHGVDIGWLERLSETVPAYLDRLRCDARPGRYQPCLRGTTSIGRDMALGFSCFALKLQHMLRRWDAIESRDRECWLDFIRGFQSEQQGGAFLDPAEIDYLKRGRLSRLALELLRPSKGSEEPRPLGGARVWYDRFWRVAQRGNAKEFAQSIVLAETKQAIATLAEVGAQPRIPFRDFPLTPEAVRTFFEEKDWSRPWGAGGQTAGLVVFIKTQAPALLPARDVEELLSICRDFYASVADAESGAYFRGARPAHGELINGAMKVLMALEWLEVPPHYPERLIQTCLAHPPSPDGCHLVDAIYVLHQSVHGGAPPKVRAYCAHIVELVRRHAHADGGFSFFVSKAQNNYYGVPISHGMNESDIHGTCLLVWALAMIWKLVSPETAAWNTMRP